jgi:hypothetical protein
LLSRFLELKHGITPYEVYRRVLSLIQDETIEPYFIKGVGAITQEYEGKIIGIEGKAVRGHGKAEVGK